MSRIEQLRARRKEIVEALTSLEQIRRGSVVEQYVDYVRKDGSVVRRGPYPLYSFKEKGKTISRRLRSDEEVKVCREQIGRFGRFRKLVEELVRIGEEISDLAPTDHAGQKKRRDPDRQGPGSRSVPEDGSRGKAGGLGGLGVWSAEGDSGRGRAVVGNGVAGGGLRSSGAAGPLRLRPSHAERGAA